MKYKYEYLYKGNPYQLTPMWSLVTTMTNMGPRVTVESLTPPFPTFPEPSRTTKLVPVLKQFEAPEHSEDDQSLLELSHSSYIGTATTSPTITPSITEQLE
jgi:hypothetical protein